MPKNGPVVGSSVSRLKSPCQPKPVVGIRRSLVTKITNAMRVKAKAGADEIEILEEHRLIHAQFSTESLIQFSIKISLDKEKQAS
jgi:hypothetical protein